MSDDADIFLAASQIDSQLVRCGFLDSVCADREQRARIESMLEGFQNWEGAVEEFVDQLSDRIADVRSGILSEDQSSASKEFASCQTRSRKYLAEGTQFGNYQIKSLLGEGGMGEVYLACDHRLGRDIALKVLSSQLATDGSWIRRFYWEAKAASGLNHPNILTIFEVGEQNGVHFIASEFVQGRTLRACLKDATWNHLQRCSALKQVAEALEVAHSANVLHRDIKPENVMVRLDGLVKVLDFGLAKWIDGPLTAASGSHIWQLSSDSSFNTQPGLIMGTIRYISPEQARRQSVDARTDIFSLGIVMYELLTGKHPFEGRTDVDVMASILQGKTIPLHRVMPDLPTELDSLVGRMLRNLPDDRVQSMSEVVSVLRGAVVQLEKSWLSSDSFSSVPLATPIQLDSTRPDADQTVIESPEVRYARSGNVNIAYQVLGRGDMDIVFVMGWVSHLEWFWKEPSFARFLNRLASFSRLILFDKRGTGLSDRVEHHELPTLEQRMEDVHVVMDAVGSEKAVLCGISEGGPMCSLFAATYPNRTLALVMMGCYARRIRTDDYPWGPTAQQHAAFCEEIQRGWGGPVGIETRAPSKASDPQFRSWWSSYLRMGASPGAAVALTKMNSQIDIRPILKSIQVPTLVIHREGDQCLTFQEGQFLADQIPGAKFVGLPGDDHLPFVGNQAQVLEAIELFLTGVKFNSRIKYVLTSVLVARLCDVSSVDEQLCDTARSHAARDVQLFRGTNFSSAPDAIVATFDGPARALRAAVAIRDSSRRLGVPMQLAVHTGECELNDQSISGRGMEVTQCLARKAQPHTILTSGTVNDLVAGADIALRPVASLSNAICDCTERIYQVVD